MCSDGWGDDDRAVVGAISCALLSPPDSEPFDDVVLGNGVGVSIVDFGSGDGAGDVGFMRFVVSAVASCFKRSAGDVG
jgi:hypothetical protein